MSMASDLCHLQHEKSGPCCLSNLPFCPPAFWVAGWVFWLQAKSSLCCEVNTGTFGEEVLNKNIYCDKKSQIKETKAVPRVCCTMSCCPHFSLGANRCGTEVSSASSIHIYHFSKGCSGEHEYQ